MPRRRPVTEALAVVALSSLPMAMFILLVLTEAAR